MSFSTDQLKALLVPESLEPREAVDMKDVEAELKRHLDKIEEEAAIVKRLTGLYALKIADRYNRNRVDYIADDKNATSVLPYVRIQKTSEHIEMIWAKRKNWLEETARIHAARVKQTPTKHGNGTLNSTIVEIKKYKKENGDFSLRMFDGEPQWAQIIGKDVETQFRSLRQARASLTDVMRKKRSVVTLLSKISPSFKPEEGNVDS